MLFSRRFTLLTFLTIVLASVSNQGYSQVVIVPCGGTVTISGAEIQAIAHGPTEEEALLWLEFSPWITAVGYLCDEDCIPPPTITVPSEPPYTTTCRDGGPNWIPASHRFFCSARATAPVDTTFTCGRSPFQLFPIYLDFID